MKWLKHIHLVDKCLMLIMLVLMLQSAVNLFINEPQNQETHTIDIIVRTSAAAIFGYFISANFIRHGNSGTTTKSGINKESGTNPVINIKTDENQQPEVHPPSADRIKNRLGFTVGESSDLEMDIGDTRILPDHENFYHTDENDPEKDDAEHLQILVTAAIGFLSLCILLIFRNFMDMTVSSAGTVSQLRDFVSGCVGFLIGSKTGGGTKSSS